MEIRNTKDLKTARWSGGTTTEILIFPLSANYADRDFLFRISTATVEEEQSEFTALSGFERILMVLEGNAELTHITEDTEKKVALKTFEQTRFSGNWKTTSKGRITDFNLIFNPALKAELKLIEDNRVRPFSGEYFFIWSMEGNVKINGRIIHEGAFAYGFSNVQEDVEVEGRACFVRLKGELLQTV